MYISDSLSLLNKNFAQALGGNILDIRYADLMRPPKEEKQISSEEIISDISKKVRGY